MSLPLPTSISCCGHAMRPSLCQCSIFLCGGFRDLERSCSVNAEQENSKAILDLNGIGLAFAQLVAHLEMLQH